MDTVNLPHPNSLRKFGLALNPARAFPAIAEEANTSLAFPNVASQQERYRSVPEIRRITKAGSADGMRKSTRWALVASSLQSANPMFKTTSRRMQRQASFSEIAGKLMDATSETSRKLSRQIHRLTRAQEEQELQRLREEEEVAQNAKKRKKDNFASSLIQRQLSIFASYRRVSFPRDTLSQKEPIERFRKIVQLLSFLLKVKTSIDRKHRSQNSSTVFAELDGESVTGVDCDGMVFDPNNFKAKREVHLSLEAIHILSLSPRSRTEEQLQTVLKALKTSVAAFGEYPLKMQRRLVSVGWYERFEAKRVIIRQGHKAENFYFILSGTAVVTLLINDAKTKEERDTTVAVLGKGSSFGELALLHHKTRSATVLCKDDVSLLAVSREDFRDIFMSYEDGREPEHIRFLRSVPYLKDLPLQDLTTKHDVCIFHYFRRGVVIVKESKTKWIYVVKSGSCRVLTHLSKKTAKFSRSAIDQERQKAVLPVIPLDDGDRRRALFTAAGDRVRPTAWSPDLTRAKTEPSFTSQQDTDLSLPAIVGEPEKFKKTAKNVAIATIVSALPKEGNEKEEQDQEELQRLNTKRTNNTNKTWRKMSPSDNQNGMSDPGQKGEQVVVQIELLKPKDQFGLSMVLFDNPAVKCHLVSNGAECVLIKKSWFLQHANEALLRKLRHQIPPYPSQAKLEQKMQDQANWDSFKSQTLNTLLDTLHL
ncbi:cyclic nucleotide-binding domain-containing protein 2-like isoform X2 [Acropora muricata]|uniref:cyclic nucleotide-binding domain-containing protein 2-like isoform X2 n=2 Tax=Acropora muricata TaxID=159855 RepID=UPI0034E4D6B3